MPTEHDALGDKEVPGEALYGIQTARAIENFPISGLAPRPELVVGIVTVKKAAALVNRELGVLAAEKAQAIVRAADDPATPLKRPMSGIRRAAWADAVSTSRQNAHTSPLVGAPHCVQTKWWCGSRFAS